MAEIHDFDDTVVAVLDHESVVRDVATALSAAGYEYEMLQGEEGKAHLDPAGESGFTATIRRLIDAFGDQFRVVEKLERELDQGRVVISVDAKPAEADEAIAILRDHHGEFIWQMGNWTFTEVGD